MATALLDSLQKPPLLSTNMKSCKKKKIFEENIKIKKITNKKSPNLCYRERLKISCLPTLYTISETVYIDGTTSALWQSLFLWWSRAAVVYLYVCMREDHLYIELIEQEKPTNTHKKENYTDAVVFAKQNCKEDFKLSRG